MIGDLIDNLNIVLETLASRDKQLSELIIEFKDFMTGLVKDKDAILGSLDSVSALANETSDLAVGIRPAFVRDVKGLRKVAAQPEPGSSEIDRALQVMPIKLTKIGRTAINGSFFNFYLCQFKGNVLLGGTRRCPINSTPAPSARMRGAISDEHAIPRTQPGPDRRDQHRRDRSCHRWRFNADNLPLVGGGDTYHAALPSPAASSPATRSGSPASESARSTPSSSRATTSRRPSRSTPVEFGTETGAAIKVKTLLGAMYISLEPAGPGQLKEDSTIPVSRTRSPYNVVQAFCGLADRAEKIDAERLAKSIDTLATLTKDTPAAFQSTLRGLSGLSRDRGRRNQQINDLLKNLHTVSGVLADRDEDIIALMKNSDVLMRALVARREAVHRLLVSTSRFSRELTLLVKQSRADLGPPWTTCRAWLTC